MGNYHQLSCMIGTYPDLAIFKQFKTANIRNLLLLQAEISILTDQLGGIIKADRSSDQQSKRDLEKQVFAMQEEQDSEKSTQWEKLLELRVLLREYNSTLLQLREVLRLPPADRTSLVALRAWLKHSSPTAGQDFLKHFESEVWDDEQDLTSLAAADENNDLISQWIDGPLTSWFHSHIGRRYKEHVLPIWDPTLTTEPTHTRLDYYPGSRAIVPVISTVFASALPTLSIFALYYVSSPTLRLGMITIFTSLFSLIFTILTKAKRSDCFAATAALAAVLVVFVGSTSNNERTIH